MGHRTAPVTENYPAQVSTVLRLRNPDLYSIPHADVKCIMPKLELFQNRNCKYEAKLQISSYRKQ